MSFSLILDFPNERAQLQFEITMKSSVICLFQAIPTCAMSELYLLVTSGDDFSPWVVGVGFQPSGPIVYLKGRVDMRVVHFALTGCYV